MHDWGGMSREGRRNGTLIARWDEAKFRVRDRLEMGEKHKLKAGGGGKNGYERKYGENRPEHY